MPLDRRFALMGLAGLLLLAAGYVAVFTITRQLSLPSAISSAVVNTVPLGVLAAATMAILRKFVVRAGQWTQVAAHLVLAPAFAVAWYFLVLVILGARDGWIEEGFSVSPFSSVAFVWQSFQGVTLYALTAMFAYLWSMAAALEAQRNETASSASVSPPATSFLVRTEGELVRMDFDDIIRISGAGDYAEVVTRTRSILSTSALATFENDLPEAGFARAHRSHIVRLGAVERAEPAGNGRMTLHLANGDTVTASRAGARRIREFSL